jgi:hypothetical protein
MSEVNFDRPLRTRQDALRDLHARRVEAKAKGQIENSSLPAGAPMYFYCKLCGLVSDVLPENYWLSRPSHRCAACARDIEDNLLQAGADSLEATT